MDDHHLCFSILFPCLLILATLSTFSISEAPSQLIHASFLNQIEGDFPTTSCMLRVTEQTTGFDSGRIVLPLYDMRTVYLASSAQHYNQTQWLIFVQKNASDPHSSYISFEPFMGLGPAYSDILTIYWTIRPEGFWCAFTLKNGTKIDDIPAFNWIGNASKIFDPKSVAEDNIYGRIRYRMDMHSSTAEGLDRGTDAKL